jgi:hypothetical protein
VKGELRSKRRRGKAENRAANAKFLASLLSKTRSGF